MQRYLSENDKYKEFLVGRQDERSHESQVVALDLREWNRRWNEITQPRNNIQSSSLPNSYPIPITDSVEYRHRKAEAVIYPHQDAYWRQCNGYGLALTMADVNTPIMLLRSISRYGNC